MRGAGWEQGSDYHWPRFEPSSSPTVFPWGLDRLLLGSGRDALISILRHGIATRRWHRLWVPGYMCQDVIRVAAGTGIGLASYTRELDSPRIDTGRETWRSDDVFLSVNLFGLGLPGPLAAPPGIDTIEDHTHDPLSQWAFESTAEYAIASLRKTLPVPSGGVLWSPRGSELPRQPSLTSIRERASHLRFGAMNLKSLYLAGHGVAKPSFLALGALAEQSIAEGPPSAMPDFVQQLLSLLPVADWRSQRRANHAHMADLLADLDGTEVLEAADESSVPFSVVVVVQHQRTRDRLLADLISQNIYPAVLWPLNEPVAAGLHQRDLDLSRRVLSIHCDWRYRGSDLERVAAVVADSLAVEGPTSVI